MLEEKWSSKDHVVIGLNQGVNKWLYGRIPTNLFRDCCILQSALFDDKAPSERKREGSRPLRRRQLSLVFQ